MNTVRIYESVVGFNQFKPTLLFVIIFFEIKAHS